MNSLKSFETLILDVWDETPDIKSFLVNDVIGIVPSPGQFYELRIYGKGEIPISYGSYVDGKLLFSIKNVGYVTSHVHKLKRGDKIGIRGPYGNGWQIDERKTVLIGGGIGLPPLSSYIERMLRINRNDMHLLYGARSPKDLVYKEKLREWSKLFRVDITVDNPDETWTGNVGVVTKLFNRIEWKDAKFFIIGPEIMMKYAVKELLSMNIDPENIYLSMERKMKCGYGICGHCNIGRFYVCKDGPVFRYDKIENIRELFH